MLTTDALKTADAEALLRPVIDQAQERLAVAVSGGADSFSLLWLVRQVKPASEIVALTVDHGLRPGSADEARAVASWCAQQNIRHQTLHWTGEKPATGVQATARTARYRLLCEACAEAQADCLLTAHNADDQAETVIARLARGSGVTGLGAMRPLTRIAAGPGRPVRLMRPLMSVPRDVLRATARANDLPFSDDPGNEDFTVERIRHRAFLAAIAAQGLLEKPALLRLAERMRQAADLSEEALLADFQNAHGYFHGTGAICLDAAAFYSLGAAARTRLLSRAIETVGGGRYPPDFEGLAVAEPLAAGAALTVGGTLVQRSQGNLWVMREPAALLGRADGGAGPDSEPVAAGSHALWDHRMIVTVPASSPEGAVLAPVGMAQSGPETARLLAATLPGLWHNDELIAVPAYAKKMLPPAAVPWKQAASTLDMELLTDERFNRRVIRF